ncbi:MAG: SH3 domain-containing protein [Candidatus Omnitrophica bacterium]|nr:SH3 domain-containing protein [Candidatus Omnitrophota bacterium]HPP00720.1 SH3 domain-containing protein [bacterium]
MKIRLVTLGTILLLGLSPQVWSDTLIFKNGTQVIGTILSMTDEKIIMDVFGTTTEFLRSEVLEIIRKEGEPPADQPPATSPETVPTETESIKPPLPETAAPAAPAAPVMPQPQAEDPFQPLLPVLLPHGHAYQVQGSAGVRFREGPDLDSPIISVLPGKTILMEVEIAGGWLRAKTLDGKEGWIHPNFVLPMESVPCLVTGENVNLREAPGELYRPLAKLRKGEVVLKLEEQGDWWFVLYQEAVSGWCNKAFLQPATDENLIRPPLRAVQNQDAGMPILMVKRAETAETQHITFTVRDPNIVLGQKTNLIVFYQDPVLFQSDKSTYMSDAIIQRVRLKSSADILQEGFPEELAVRFVGGDILTLEGQPAAEGWQFQLTAPESAALAFAFVVQKGPARGTVVLVP